MRVGRHRGLSAGRVPAKEIGISLSTRCTLRWGRWQLGKRALSTIRTSEAATCLRASPHSVCRQLRRPDACSHARPDQLAAPQLQLRAANAPEATPALPVPAPSLRSVRRKVRSPLARQGPLTIRAQTSSTRIRPTPRSSNASTAANSQTSTSPSRSRSSSSTSCFLNPPSSATSSGTAEETPNTRASSTAARSRSSLLSSPSASMPVRRRFRAAPGSIVGRS